MDDANTATGRGVGRFVLAILSLPIALMITTLSLTVQLGNQDAGAELVQVVFLLLVALTLPVTVLVSGARAVRSSGSTSPGMVLGSLLFASAAVVGALGTALPLVIDLSGEIAQHVQAIAEQDDLSPAQLEAEVRPLFEETVLAMGGTGADLDLRQIQCDTPSGDPGVGYDQRVEIAYDGDAAAVESAVRDVWAAHGYDAEEGYYGLFTESDGAIWTLELDTFPHKVQFVLVTSCYLDPTAT